MRLPRKVLIANRGEIAVRIAEVCRTLGVRTVAVYSEADAGAPHTRAADEAVLIGPPAAKDSYLAAEKILDAARATGADAVHPGYGFLSENDAFAEACAAAGITFVGPPPEAMRKMGDKAVARASVAAVGVPVVPGSDGVVAPQRAPEVAALVGYPVLVKAAAGGGGIGMQVARDEAELQKALRSCADRARAAFGDDAVYLERYFDAPRHIEVQVLGDQTGHLVHLFERECSIQRRHQKVLEETPSPLLAAEPALAERMYAAAVAAAKSVGYFSAGTVEFLVSGREFYFIEMNTRLQVEHPVTELTTGVDIVGWMLRIAAGEPLALAQSDIRRSGHAIEMRVYAEDPVRFLPSPGTLTRFEPPTGEGVRVDAGYAAGQRVTPYYDPLLAKLIVHGATRAEAIARGRAAAAAFAIEGIKHNLPLHARILASDAFARGELDTHFLERLPKE